MPSAAGDGLFRSMTDDILLCILRMVNSPEDLASAQGVCRRWFNLVSTEDVWEKLCFKINPVMADTFCAVAKHTTYSTIEEEDSAELKKRLKSELFCQLAWEFTKPPYHCNQIQTVLKASSYFGDNFDGIVYTLVPNSVSAWTSSGSVEQEGIETLTYGLESPVTLVHEILLKPDRCHEPEGDVLASRAVKFRFGFQLTRRSHSLSFAQQYIEQRNAMLKNVVWTYESPIFHMEPIAALQRFVLPSPVLCVGGILEVQFIDKVGSPSADDLFYLRISYVKAIGRPLYRFEYDLDKEKRVATLRLKNPQTTGANSAGSSEEVDPHHNMFSSMSSENGAAELKRISSMS